MAHSCSFTDDDIITVDDGTWVNDSIEIELVICPELHVLRLAEVWSLKHLIFLLGVRVGAEEG